MSYGLNYGNAPIALFSGGSFFNSSATTFEGKAGDDKAYIVGAPAMKLHFQKLMGTHDAVLTTREEGEDFEASLAARQGAVFAGAEHTGLITGLIEGKKDYRDPYVIDDSSILPVYAWKLA